MRARPVAGRGPAPFSRGQGQDKAASVPFSRGQGQHRSAPAPFSRAGQDRSAPRNRGFSRERSLAGPPGVEDALGPGSGSASHAHKAPIRTPERSQRSSGAHDGSRDSRRDDHVARLHDTAQRPHSSSSRPSRGTSGAAVNSPMRSSGMHQGSFLGRMYLQSPIGWHHAAVKLDCVADNKPVTDMRMVCLCVPESPLRPWGSCLRYAGTQSLFDT